MLNFFHTICVRSILTGGTMEQWVRVAAWAPEDTPNEPLPLKLAPGSATGFVGVHKAGKMYEARKWVKGKGTRVVFKSDDPRMCAWVLARLDIYPCELPSPKKKLLAGTNATARKRASDARAPLSPRRFNASCKRVQETCASEPSKQQKSARASEPEARPVVPDGQTDEWFASMCFVP